MSRTGKIAALFILGGYMLFATDLPAQKQLLSHDQIFDLRQTNNPVEIVKWIDDNSFIVSKRDEKRILSLIKIKKKEQIPIEEKDLKQYYPEPATKRLEVQSGNISYDGEQIVSGNSKNAVLSPDSAYIAYTKDNDLYAVRISDKKEFRLTNDGSDVILNGYASWAYMEEILGRSSHFRAFWWSPDSKTIAFFRTDDSKVPLFSITDSRGLHGYIETMRYPKSGDNNPEVKIGLVDPEGKNSIVWADFDSKEDQYFGKPLWTPSGKNIWIQWINRGQDNYKLFDINLVTGKKTEIYSETQKTWIDIDKDNRINFLPSGNGAIIISDKSGYNHLYLSPNPSPQGRGTNSPQGRGTNSAQGTNSTQGTNLTQGTNPTPITQGEFNVLDIIRIDEKNKTVYFTCFKDNIGCVDFYKASFDGKNLQRLSFGNYTHRISLSPDAKYFVSVYSNTLTPPATALYDTKGKLVMELGNSRNEQNEIYEWAKTEFVTVKSDDGKYDLPMRVILPVNMEKDKKYPVIIHVYGGPAAINVWQGWSSGSMSHWYAYEGLVQVAIDHRGSLHFGKKGQDEMHRNLGKVEVTDYSTCVKWLIENAQVDPERVCINGFSYGGYITCYSLLSAPDVFTHGIAGGSVTDWMLYDAPYTERFMDHPDENPEGYKQSSALTHAGNLKGKLLLTHGLIDENVHVQNTFQLVSEFEDKNKFFDLVIYPSNRHGYGGAKGRHFRNLQIKFIYEHLLRKSIPERLKKEM
ncbi:MAG: DPP IV N-terminal domain-containing protein [Prevotellaceae bacterium]|jgi:dipeptidyl-peptidase-4|nr:DPP IV N-terminal domain-containing protein [Prevotellaceae bacterium]